MDKLHIISFYDCRKGLFINYKLTKLRFVGAKFDNMVIFGSEVSTRKASEFC